MAIEVVNDKALEPKTWYCRSAGYCVSITKGQVLLGEDKVHRRTGEKFLQFYPMGAQVHSGLNFGRAVVTDPEINAWVEQHRAELQGQMQDILTPEEFSEVAIPAEMQLQQARRELKEKNRLIAELQKIQELQGKIAEKPAQAK